MSYNNSGRHGKCHKGKKCNKGKNCKKCSNVCEVGTSSDCATICPINTNDCTLPDAGAVIPYATGTEQIYLATTNNAAPVGTLNPFNDIIDSLAIIGFGGNYSLSPVAINADAIGINFSSDTSAPPIRLYNFAFVAPRNGCIRNLAVNFNNLTVSTLNLPSNAVINCVGQIFIATQLNNIFIPTQLRSVVPIPVPVQPVSGAPGAVSQPIFLPGPYAGLNYVDVAQVNQGDRVLLVSYLISGPNVSNLSYELDCNLSAGIIFA